MWMANIWVRMEKRIGLIRLQKRTIFSGWDVFRSQMPLQTIINPVLVNDLLKSLTTMAEGEWAWSTMSDGSY